MKNRENKHKTNKQKADISPNTSIITLQLNGQNTS